MQTEKECYLTGANHHLHKHHIYGGRNRQKSEENGFWVYLREDWHNMSNYGVHFNKVLDTFLKQTCQTEFEKTKSRAEFLKIIGRNYL